MVRAKFYVSAIEQYAYFGQTDEYPGARIKLQPVFASKRGVDGNTCEENAIFGKYTPSGEISLTIRNPEAVKEFELGKPYYVDFQRAEVEVEKTA